MNRTSSKEGPARGALLTRVVWLFSLLPCRSVAQLCPAVCDPMGCSTPGFLVLHQLPELAQTPVCGVSDAIPPSRPLSPLLLLPSVFPGIGGFSVSQLFASGGQSIGASASASVLPMTTQGLFPLGWTGLVSLQSKGLPRVLAFNMKYS